MHMAGFIALQFLCVILAFFLPYVAVMWRILRIRTQTELSDKMKLHREIAYDGVAYAEEVYMKARKIRLKGQEREMPGKQVEAIKYMRSTGQFDGMDDEALILIIDSMLGKLENVGASGNRRI